MTLFFLFLDGIIKEEVYQNRIDLCIGVYAKNLSANEFHAPDAAASQLDLP